MPFIPFGEYLPDLPSIANPGATVAENVMPATASYRPLRGLNSQAATLDAYARGAVSARDKSGATFNFAGDVSKLYTVTASSATDASNGVYTLNADDGWEFAKFGETVVAVSITQAPQAITLGAANFANLGGSPPKARHVCTIGKQDAFLALGNVDDVGGDGLVPNRVQWSAAGDEAGWTSGTNLAGQQDLQGNGGWIQRVCGGEFGVVFQERSIWRMDFVGAPDVFSFSEVEEGRGTPAPGSVIQVGNLSYYWGNDGVYVFDGARSIPLGAGKVDKTLFQEVDQTNFNRVSAISDPINDLVVWAYPTGNSKGNGDPDRLLILDAKTGKFSQANVDLELVFLALNDTATVDGAELVSELIDGTFADVPLDSRQFVGNALIWSAFNRSNQLAYFNGDVLPATLETGEFRGNPEGTSLLSAVEPVVEPDIGSASATDHDDVSVHVSARSDSLQAPVLSNSTLVNSRTGEADFRDDGTFHKVRVNIASSDWNHASGVNATLTPTGRL